MNLLEFFSREAGQKRRRWLDETVGDAIEYFIPPNLRPAAEFVAEANPVQAMGNAMSAGGVVFDPDQTREARLRAAGDMGLEMAMSLAPAALVRMGYLAAPAGLLETFSTPSIDAAVDMGRGLLSDAQYAGRSIAQGDPRGVLEAFQRRGEAQSLSAASKVEELRRQANIQRFGYDPNELPEVDTSYRISHQPSGPKDENPIRLDDLTKTVTGETAGYPEDFYGNQGARIYAPPRSFADDEYGIANEESYDVIRNVRNNPDAEVTIYRAVPNSDDINTINEGDWITLSPKYAEVHAASGYGRSGDEAGKVISKKVRVKDIYWAGDDVNEFGYFPDTSIGDVSESIQAFHGTPHDFDRFDLSKIGTGEGAQVYGHGLYFAEAEPVAKSYREQIAGGNTGAARRALESVDGDINKAIAKTEDALRRLDERAAVGDYGNDKRRFEAQRQIQIDKLAQLQNYKKTGEFDKGRVYEVAIQGNPNQFLDWDKPLSEQPNIARLLGYDDPDAIAAAKAEQYAKFRVPQNDTFEELFAPLSEQEQLAAESLTAMPVSWGNMTGKDAYEAMKDKLGALDWPATADKDTRRRYGKQAASKASSAMRDAGILGIKYLDQMSRGAGQGSRNYVVFDDKLISIVRKYGIAGAAALLGVSSADIEGALAQGMPEQPKTGLLQ